MIEAAVKENPGADGFILGSHGLFTWGATQRECYLNSIRTIDQMGEFIDAASGEAAVQLFGGLAHKPLDDRAKFRGAHSARAARHRCRRTGA